MRFKIFHEFLNSVIILCNKFKAITLFRWIRMIQLGAFENWNEWKEESTERSEKYFGKKPFPIKHPKKNFYFYTSNTF